MDVGRQQLRLLTLGEAARRLQVEPAEMHSRIEEGSLRYHSRDNQGRLWFDQATVDRLALTQFYGEKEGHPAGKGIDDGRPERRRTPHRQAAVVPPAEAGSPREPLHAKRAATS